MGMAAVPTGVYAYNAIGCFLALMTGRPRVSHAVARTARSSARPQRRFECKSCQGTVLPKHLSILQQQVPAVIEDKPMIVQPRGQDCMSLAGPDVADQHEPKILSRDAGKQKGCQLRDRIVFAVSLARRECCERRAPDILDAMLRHVGRRLDGQVNSAVDKAEPSAAPVRAPGLDNGEEPFGTRRTIDANGVTCSEHIEIRSHSHR